MRGESGWSEGESGWKRVKHLNNVKTNSNGSY